jgi:hypothetical protein
VNDFVFPTNTVKLLQMEGVDDEREGDEIPRVRLAVDGHVEEVVQVAPEVPEHRHHVREEVFTHRHLKGRFSFVDFRSFSTWYWIYFMIIYTTKI